MNSWLFVKYTVAPSLSLWLYLLLYWRLYWCLYAVCILTKTKLCWETGIHLLDIVLFHWSKAWLSKGRLTKRWLAKCGLSIYRLLLGIIIWSLIWWLEAIVICLRIIKLATSILLVTWQLLCLLCLVVYWLAKEI